MSLMNLPTNKVQAKTLFLSQSEPIDWNSYLQSHIINENDYAFISKFDSGDDSDKVGIINNLEAAGVEKLLSIISRMSKEQTVAYLLMRLDAILDNIYPHLKSYADKEGIAPCKFFMDLMNRQDLYISHMCCKLVSKVMALSQENLSDQDLDFYFGWIRSQILQQNQDYLQSTITCIQTFLKKDYYRQKFFNFNELSYQLLPLIKSKYGSQLQYQISYVFWLLSYNKSIAQSFASDQTIVEALSEALKNVQKEKVVRIIVATFVNVIKSVESFGYKTKLRSFNLHLINLKVPRSLDLIMENFCNLEPKNLTQKVDNQQDTSAGSKQTVVVKKKSESEIDPDLVDDCQFLSKTLYEAEATLSSFEEYMTELDTGRLDFTPVHKSQNFWANNAHKFNDNKYSMLVKLRSILESQASETRELKVACHDLGEYTRYYPIGKQVLENLGIKSHIMRLMLHKDKHVQLEALRAVQKMMVQNWEFISEKVDKERSSSFGKSMAVK